jgi:c(7)-type cytochrome triheme protein
MERGAIILLLVLVSVDVLFAETGIKKKRPLPSEYGRVIISNYSEKQGMAPVVFDHWQHRINFTCRVCHVEVGFAMKAGGTGIRAVDNMNGFYCGACHNGEMVFKDKKVFASCQPKGVYDDTRCDRCHSLGKQVKRDFDFYTVTAKFPKERFGNGINWEQAEEDGYIHPASRIQSIKIKKPVLKVQPDFALNPKVEGMPEIVFSHKKHTVWNGCEVCHPETFTGVKKGLTKYSMPEKVLKANTAAYAMGRLPSRYLIASGATLSLYEDTFICSCSGANSCNGSAASLKPICIFTNKRFSCSGFHRRLATGI